MRGNPNVTNAPPHPLETQSPPIFFVGSARSGTSLISRLIGSHPNIAVPFESHFYNGFLPWLPHYGDLRVQQNRNRLLGDILQSVRLREWTPRVDEQAARERIEANGRFDFAGVVAGIMATWCNDQGKHRWGEKTPPHIFFADAILRDFPDSQFIHIVRDGRDVALSWKQVKFGPKHVYPGAVRWSKVIEAGDELKQKLGPTQYLELRYEDLLHDTVSTVRRVCDYLGEEFNEDMLRFYHANDKYPTDARNEANLAKPVMSNNAGQWRRHLSQREIRIFEAVAGGQLASRGYELVYDRPRLSSLERACCKYLEHPPRKIVTMATNGKGQWEALVRSATYLRLRAGI